MLSEMMSGGRREALSREIGNWKEKTKYILELKIKREIKEFTGLGQ
jgi:hypothetical protein